MHASVNGVWTATMMIVHRDPAAESWVNRAVIGALVVGVIAFIAAVIILRRPVAEAPAAARRGRLAPRVAAASLATVTVLAFVIPAATPSIAQSQPALLQPPTIAHLTERVSAHVSVASVGQEGTAEFTLLPETTTRLMLPPNKAGVREVLLSLDAGGKLVWLAYSGELTAKGHHRLPTGVLEQLASGVPTRLCLTLDATANPPRVNVRATLEEDDARVAAALAYAEREGWATRGRK
jgi:hypothetical protein